MKVLNVYPIRDSDSSHKKITIFAKFLHERHLMALEKSEWKLLLKQFLIENGSFPLQFGNDGFATSVSMVSFAKLMDKFSERIIRPDDPTFYVDNPGVLILTTSVGFGNTVTLKLSAK